LVVVPLRPDSRVRDTAALADPTLPLAKAKRVGL
jgi:hypothetical protein